VQRKLTLVEKKSEKIIDDYSKTFKDYDLKDGTYLVMKEFKGKMR
jgi:hypothetical protein